ncbi:DMT family transporter [Rhizobium sp. AG855]|uniref:DMT family transporter n=1 Tax=Rhizobium sp. AG855 TaxID=2183898 RepID=UPI000E7439D0|nr:DMT family transporter [Rhizobium sp. AG855]RKE83896.1 EamA-like transporter family protein [Rhizobium sp. AG855]
MPMSTYSRGLIAVTAATFALSTAGLMTRLVSIDGPTLLFLRGLIAGLFLLLCLVVTARGRVVADFVRLGWSGLLICATSAACAVLFIGALYTTSVAHVAIIFATCPFIAAGLGFLLLGERPGRVALVASGVAMAGVAVMIGSGEEGALLGDLLAFAMTGMVALWTVLIRRHPDKPALPCSVVSCFLSAAVALPFAAPFATSSHDLSVVLGFGVLAFSLGFLLLTLGARDVPPVESALIGALDAPLAPFWVWLVIGDQPSPTTIIGGVVVLAAVVGHVLVSRHAPPPLAVLPLDP